MSYQRPQKIPDPFQCPNLVLFPWHTAADVSYYTTPFPLYFKASQSLNEFKGPEQIDLNFPLSFQFQQTNGKFEMGDDKREGSDTNFEQKVKTFFLKPY